ncbi:RING finger domain-containing protein [Sansalvadorimonas verongulae]|uniref:RING finger domain-containing protein n=1 Tax=Sansalvadorimonas verongulae TaxID=2172824 RepID=UPI0012BBEB09|nr:RING finger domain-containing protein [Sansalvadorimonas verongulae]MTI12036.1 hypothetical protein [Sansalvadorimonas verongulae]
MSLGKYTIRLFTTFCTLLYLCCAVPLNVFAGVDNKRTTSIKPAISLENTAASSRAAGSGQVVPDYSCFTSPLSRSRRAEREVKPGSDNPETMEVAEQSLLEKHLATIGMEDYVITEVPRDNQCWKHVLRLQANDFFGYTRGVEELLLDSLESLTGEQLAIFTEKQKSTLNQELLSDELPAFDLLGPFLATLINRPVIIVHLESWKKDLTSDQVFHTYLPKSIGSEITTEKPDASITENAIWLGWIMSENHYLSLSHKKNPLTTCTICLEGFRWRDNMHSTTCHHLFHSKCLLDALKEARHCPVCRQWQPVYKPERCPGKCSLSDFYLSKEEMKYERARHTPCPRGNFFECGQNWGPRTFVLPSAFIAHRRTHITEGERPPLHRKALHRRRAHIPEGRPFVCDQDRGQRTFLLPSAFIAHRRAHFNSR